MTDESNTIEKIVSHAKQAARQKELARAEALLEPVLAAHPDNLPALDLMGFVRFFQQRYADCELLCRRALRIKPHHAYALHGLGMALSKQGNLTDGVMYLEKAMATSPKWPEPYWDMAVVLMNAGKPDKAKSILLEGIEKIPASKPRFERLLSRL